MESINAIVENILEDPVLHAWTQIQISKPFL
jgi:hypothetical protein